MDIRRVHRDIGMRLFEEAPDKDPVLRLMQGLYETWEPVKGWQQTDVIAFVAGLIADERRESHGS